MAQITKITSNSRQVLKALEAVPGAVQKMTAATLTETAQAVTTRSERNIKREMIVRTTYTTKSLVTYKASATKPIERQNAVAGTKSEYLPVQDQGGKIRAKGKRMAIPTNKVRGKDRKKRVPKRYRMDQAGQIQWTRPFAKGARFFVLYPTTVDQTDEKHWYSKKSRGKQAYRRRETFGRKGRGSHGAYRLSRPAIFTRVGKSGKLVKVRDVGEKSVKVKARRWHSEAVAKYGNYTFMARRFEANAKRYLEGKWE